MNVARAYLDTLVELMNRIVTEEASRIERAAQLIARAAEDDRIIHVVGAGHSAMLGEELFYRAGGLANVSPIIDTDINVSHGAEKSTMMESIPGYARALLRSAPVKEGDVVIVVSTSGVNMFPVEAAIVAKELGAATIGITSVEYSRSLEPRNSFGKRLYEVVEVYIDNKVPRGDAVLDLGIPTKVSPVSTILNCFIGNTLIARAVQILLEKGVEPPIWVSSHLPEAREHNRRLFEKFKGRIKLL
ncbi:MAG: SIS domain-containing protein [Crenarchaeota archaeon]|nr:SIS domain-containing protein [Thermoproteota archaeon]